MCLLLVYLNFSSYGSLSSTGCTLLFVPISMELIVQYRFRRLLLFESKRWKYFVSNKKKKYVENVEQEKRV